MEKPDDQEAQVTLGEVLNSEGRYGEAADFYLRAKLPYMAAWSYYRNRQAPEANAAADQALAMKRSVKYLMLKIEVTIALEDRNAALSLIAEIPASAYTDDRTASSVVNVALSLSDSEKVLEILRSTRVIGSRGLFRGRGSPALPT